MSMRSRLTLTMTILSGAAFIILGVLVYVAVFMVMLDWVDSRLADAADRTLEQLKTYGPSQFDLPAFSPPSMQEIYLIQIWGVDGKLMYANHTSQQQPLDDYGWQVWQPVYSTAEGDYGEIRVLSVPIYSDRGAMGLLMIGKSLAALNMMRRVLMFSLIIVSLLAWVFTAAIIWWSSDRTVRPLRRVTEVLPRILEADDLSRRIPPDIAPDDEVGRLVQMINNMLERLEQLFSTQKRFLSDVSHELRTPLTVIKGEVGLLRKMGRLDEESLVSIESEVDRLSRLVGDLLLLGQAESGKLALNLAPIDLDGLLMDVYQQTVRLVSGRLTLKIVEIEPVRMLGDQDRLKQVLINLVSNAVQHTPAGGTVSMALRQANTRAQILISDTGSGISADDLPHVFERFYRGEKSRQRKPGGGFGLGLSISYWIVRAHGGAIDVTSQEGIGTTFSVWLPLVTQETKT